MNLPPRWGVKLFWVVFAIAFLSELSGVSLSVKLPPAVVIPLVIGVAVVMFLLPQGNVSGGRDDYD